jgi:hypothetical protein
MLRILTGVIFGMTAILTGLGFLLPSMAKLRDYGALSTAGLLLIGVLFVIVGVGAMAYGVVQARRKAIPQRQ